MNPVEIGTGIVVTDPLLGNIWGVTRDEEGTVTMRDPYGVAESRTMSEKTFQFAMKLKIWKFAWTFEEAKDWD